MAAEHGSGDSRERIPERIDEQIVDLSLKTETSLEDVLASKAASKNSWAQVTTGRGVDGAGKRDAGAPVGDGWSRGTDVFTVSAEFVL